MAFSKVFLVFLFVFSFNLNASVWQDNQSWSLQYEEQFSAWMKSNKVVEEIFTDANSPYFGVSTDCADTAYAFRAIFAFEHNLPFAIYNPSGSRGTSNTLNNRLNNWDAAGAPNKRLVAMINEIGDSVGTENLAYFDTFPVAIKSITPGSVFMYKITARLGKFIRHTYNIKNINPVGTFDVIYSTQANKAKGLPLVRRKDKEFENMPSNPWGFKKFRWPELLGLDLSAIPAELGPSMEQYTLATNLGEVEFFKYVRKTLSSTYETTPERLVRSFQTVCAEAQARIGYVNQALIHLQETNNKCMDYEEFDAYSTPARDASLIELFEKYELAYNDLQSEGLQNKVAPEMLSYAETIFNNKFFGSSELLAACPINYREGVSIDLATLWKRLSKNTLSSHPNDTVELRWGETTRGKTKCKRWY